MRPTILPIRKLITGKMKLVLICLLCVCVLFVTTATTMISSSYYGNEKDGSQAAKRGESSSPEHTSSEVEDVANLETLRLVQVIFRHGDRNPLQPYPNDLYKSRKYWPEGYGRLSRTGKLMQYQLGQYIRKRYEGFLSTAYNPDEIYVQSSDFERTIRSAMANMGGLYPPLPEDPSPAGSREQFVPVHSLPSTIDNKIAFARKCPRYDLEFANALSHAASEQDWNKKHEPLYKFLTEQAGFPVISYFNVSDIYDTLFVQTNHNLTLPSWASKIFPDTLKPHAERWIKAHTFSNEMRKLRTGPILTDFVRNMKRAIAKPSEEEQQILQQLFQTPAAKFYVYSGHDTTLAAILDGLGLYTGKIPGYAASLYFELHEHMSEKKNFVKIFYRPDRHKGAHELQFQNCGSSTSPCWFEDFMKSIEGYMMDENEWEKACAI